MNFISEDNYEELVIAQRDKPPSHYIFKIQNFSLLSKHSIEKHDSRHFEVGGYKWKLSLYPNGSKEKSVKDGISLYLVMADASSLPFGWEVNVKLGASLLDQNRDKYITVEGRNVRRFHALKTEWGFSQLIPLSTFKDPSNGYLVNDTCVFGVDVFVIESAAKGECLSMVKEPVPFKHTWKITGYSQLTSITYSDVFQGGGHKWKIQIYPLGNSVGKKDGSVSIFLCLDFSESDSPAQNVYANFKISVREQSGGNHHEATASACCCFCSSSKSWGWNNFMKLDYLKNVGNGFLVNDTCIIEADVTVCGSVNEFP